YWSPEPGLVALSHKQAVRSGDGEYGRAARRLHRVQVGPAWAAARRGRARGDREGDRAPAPAGQAARARAAPRAAGSGLVRRARSLRAAPRAELRHARAAAVRGRG